MEANMPKKYILYVNKYSEVIISAYQSELVATGLEELTGRDFQRLTDTSYGYQSNVMFPAFYSSHVTPVEFCG